MNKYLRPFFFVLASGFFLWGAYDIISLIIIKRFGEEITARVVNVDINCDRYNFIQVEHDGFLYNVPIDRNSCKEKLYKIGQKVTLLKYREKKSLIWPEAKYEWLPFLISIVLFLGYYTNKNKFADSK